MSVATSSSTNRSIVRYKYENSSENSSSQLCFGWKWLAVRVKYVFVVKWSRKLHWIHSKDAALGSNMFGCQFWNIHFLTCRWFLNIKDLNMNICRKGNLCPVSRQNRIKHLHKFVKIKSYSKTFSCLTTVQSFISFANPTTFVTGCSRKDIYLFSGD